MHVVRKNGIEVTVDDLGSGLQITAIRSPAGEVRFQRHPHFRLLFYMAGQRGPQLPQAYLASLSLGAPIRILPEMVGFFIGRGILFPLDSGGEEVIPEPLVNLGDGEIDILWSIRWPLSAGIIEVRTRIAIIGDEVDFAIKVKARFSPWALWRVDFPCLVMEPEGKPEDQFFVLPWLGGGLVRDPAHQMVPGRRLVPYEDSYYPGFPMTMQFMATYGTGRTLVFLHAKDGDFLRKFFFVQGNGSGTRFELRNVPPDNEFAGNDPKTPFTYEMPYPFRLAVLHGNWYDAARKYRAWALDQVWTARGPMEKSAGFSPQVRAKVVGIARGNPDGGVGPGGFDAFDVYAEDCIRLAEYLGTRNVGALWFYWHTNDFGARWPESGVKSTVVPALRRLQAAALTASFYTLPESWDIQTDTFLSADAPRFTFKRSNGSIVTLPAFNKSGVTDQAIIDSYWRESWPWMKKTMDLLAHEVGVDGLYLDVWSGASTGPDYERRLPTTGGGNLQTLGRRAFGEIIRNAYKVWDGSRFRRPEFAIVSEFPDETMLDLAEEVVVPVVYASEAAYPYFAFVAVPLWATVYHEFQIGTDLIDPTRIATETDLAQNLFALALVYHLGKVQYLFSTRDVPLLPDAPESIPFPRFWEFLRRLVAADPMARRYQIFGERLRSIPGTPEWAIDDSSAATDLEVQASAWRSRGDIGFLVTNTSDQERVFTLVVDPARYPLPESGFLSALEGSTRKPIGPVSGGFTHVLALPPDSVTLVEIFRLPAGSPMPAFPAFVDSAGDPGPVRLAEQVVLVTGRAGESAEGRSREVPTGGRSAGSVTIMVSRIDAATDLNLGFEVSNDRQAWITHAFAPPIGIAGVHTATFTGVRAAWMRLRYILSTDSGIQSVAIFGVTLVQNAG